MPEDKVSEFQRKYPTRAEKEAALMKMSNDQIDELIAASTIVQAKIFYSRFKKTESTDSSNTEQ